MYIQPTLRIYKDRPPAYSWIPAHTPTHTTNQLPIHTQAHTTTPNWSLGAPTPTHTCMPFVNTGVFPSSGFFFVYLNLTQFFKGDNGALKLSSRALRLGSELRPEAVCHTRCVEIRACVSVSPFCLRVAAVRALAFPPSLPVSSSRSLARSLSVALALALALSCLLALFRSVSLFLSLLHPLSRSLSVRL